jgi:malate dehydrogenase (oxaloacetate-decarboxylating)(NADP+)
MHSNKRVSLSGRHNINPLSFVDTAAIDAQMKLASLNHLAGYSTKAYPAAVEQSASTQYTPEEMARGYQVLREPAWNKGENSSSLVNNIPRTNLLQALPSHQSSV